MQNKVVFVDFKNKEVIKDVVVAVVNSSKVQMLVWTISQPQPYKNYIVQLTLGDLVLNTFQTPPNKAYAQRLVEIDKRRIEEDQTLCLIYEKMQQKVGS